MLGAQISVLDQLLDGALVVRVFADEEMMSTEAVPASHAQPTDELTDLGKCLLLKEVSTSLSFCLCPSLTLSHILFVSLTHYLSTPLFRTYT